ncbi:hypothetical protein KIPB_015903, partial [Kipferlia bialata]|eukprot:g15903.t1
MPLMMIHAVDDGITLSAIREIKILYELKHDCVVNLHEVFYHGSHIYMVMECCHMDLFHVLSKK